MQCNSSHRIILHIDMTIIFVVINQLEDANLVGSQQQECLHCLQVYSRHILHCINIRLSRNSDGINPTVNN
jgi:hypothetical protein